MALNPTSEENAVMPDCLILTIEDWLSTMVRKGKVEEPPEIRRRYLKRRAIPNVTVLPEEVPKFEINNNLAESEIYQNITFTNCPNELLVRINEFNAQHQVVERISKIADSTSKFPRRCSWIDSSSKISQKEPNMSPNQTKDEDTVMPDKLILTIEDWLLTMVSKSSDEAVEPPEIKRKYSKRRAIPNVTVLPEEVPEIEINNNPKEPQIHHQITFTNCSKELLVRINEFNARYQAVESISEKKLIDSTTKFPRRCSRIPSSSKILSEPPLFKMEYSLQNEGKILLYEEVRPINERKRVQENHW